MLLLHLLAMKIPLKLQKLHSSSVVCVSVTAVNSPTLEHWAKMMAIWRPQRDNFYNLTPSTTVPVMWNKIEALKCGRWCSKCKMKQWYKFQLNSVSPCWENSKKDKPVTVFSSRTFIPDASEVTAGTNCIWPQHSQTAGKSECPKVTSRWSSESQICWHTFIDF